jgi:carbamoylphosphate synthase large subunit
MNSKPIAIVLGGTFPHITLIKKLQQRGYYVILIDYLDNPPAKTTADEHIRESTLDEKKVCEIAKGRNASIVISTCVDQANATACYVAERLGLFAPYSYEIAINVTNKIFMKTKMTENDIPTSKYIKLKDSKNIKYFNLQYPLIVKPSDSNSSKGVLKVNTEQELLKYSESALALSRSKEVIIEEYKEGKEIGVDCFVKDGEVDLIMTRERRKIKRNIGAAQQIYGSFWPADLNDDTVEKLRQIANKIANVFNLKNTPLMIQAIVSENEINVIEFAPRIGGGENYKIIPLLTGFDIVDAAIDSFLGISVNPEYKWPEYYMADNYLYAKPGLFGSIGRYENLINAHVIEYLNIYRKYVAEIGAEISSNNRVGAFIVTSDTKAGLLDKIEKGINEIEIYDTNGNPIMRRDIY